ncbi:MAG: CvpA family protein [Pseudomonadales bacterium]|nr:CvpA family protein [Pseudomonadales bacterium]
MAIADWIIIGIFVVSSLVSIKRGFVKEALSLATWIAALIVGRLFAAQLSTLLVDYIDTPSVRLGVAFAVLFAATLIVGAMVNHLMGEFVKMTGLSGTDRVFGMVFGVARGGVIVLVLVLILHPTPVAEDPWWQESLLIPQFLEVVEWLWPLVLEQSREILEKG